MKTAVIIPSLNSPIINQVIEAVLNQDGLPEPPEIIVVGKDERNLIVSSYHINFIDTGEPILAAAARNLGVTVTNADLLVFLDSDCVPTSDWLKQHQIAQENGHLVVSGSVLPEGQNYWQLLYNLTLFHEILRPNPAGNRDFLATLNLSVAREVWESVGGMTEDINRVEDVDWTTRMRRAGIQPYFWPEAAVKHIHSRMTFGQVWRDCALSGYHMRQLRLRHSDMLQAPSILQYPSLVWWLSPFIGAWATGRILKQRSFILRRFWHTVPALYLTKIAWCWGASRTVEPT